MTDDMEEGQLKGGELEGFPQILKNLKDGSPYLAINVYSDRFSPLSSGEVASPIEISISSDIELTPSFRST